LLTCPPTSSPSHDAATPERRVNLRVERAQFEHLKTHIEEDGDRRLCGWMRKEVRSARRCERGVYTPRFMMSPLTRLEEKRGPERSPV
jgi:hypothetical protein